MYSITSTNYGYRNLFYFVILIASKTKPNLIYISFLFTAKNMIKFQKTIFFCGRSRRRNSGQILYCSDYYSKHLHPRKAILFLNIKIFFLFIYSDGWKELSHSQNIHHPISWPKNTHYIITEMNNIANKFPYVILNSIPTNKCVSVLQNS